MSRLDSFIRRMSAQRDALNQLKTHVPPDGLILELGLGNGRTYDHLVEHYGAERIIVFDRDGWPKKLRAAAPRAFVSGEIKETGRNFKGVNAVLVHVDIGAGDEIIDRETVTWLPSLVADLVGEGGFVLSGLELASAVLRPMHIDNVDSDRYYLYRRISMEASGI